MKRPRYSLRSQAITALKIFVAGAGLLLLLWLTDKS